MRLLDSPAVDESVKKAIRLKRKSLNPVALALQVANLQKKLLDHAEHLQSAYPQDKGA
ncbi:MAG: hypothetical protein P1P77_16475 [Spirochaetaceae bacterium]|nr:hypothetical protein [Spirochaetaceae bacterium]